MGGRQKTSIFFDVEGEKPIGKREKSRGGKSKAKGKQMKKRKRK